MVGGRFKMNVFFALSAIFFACVSIGLLAVLISKAPTGEEIHSTDIETMTDAWIHEVVNRHDSEAIYKLFCSDGSLIGTVSQVKRKGRDIKKYFDYFAKLPGIRVVKKNYNISKVTRNVYVNTAFITWKWDAVETPVIARMTFLFRNKCIFQLHSSKLPEMNESLKKSVTWHKRLYFP